MRLTGVTRRLAAVSFAICAAVVGLASCSRARVGLPESAPRRLDLPHAVIPAPTSAQISPDDSFRIDSTTVIVVAASAPPDVERIARDFAEQIGHWIVRAPRRLTAGETPPRQSIYFRSDTQNAALGDEGYELTVTRDAVTLAANQPAGVFYGVQTLRQLMPVSLEYRASIERRLAIPGARIVDSPRFAWRGAMLDVARHFLPADQVKRFVDLIAYYKMNRLHLHLTDDQGWRIEIKSRPNLATVGGRLEIGDGPGGYYTQAQFADIVAYAQSRFVTIVPEIEMPGHGHAALASYPELTCGAGRGGGNPYSTFCVDKDTVYSFITDVLREVAGLVPGPYFHIGGDEVEGLTTEQYHRFLERVQGIVQARGKRMIGWGEIAPAKLTASTIVHHWKPDSSYLQVARGGKVLLSPSTKVYLDMKYDSLTVLGFKWAAFIEVRDAYDWEPGTLLPGVTESAILGVEAPLWSETVERPEDFEFMAFPRLAAVAEVGWTPQSARSWEPFRLRLAAHGPRLVALGVNFYRSPQVPWMR